MGVSVIGHGNPTIAKRRNSLNSQSLVCDGDRQAPPGSSKSFQKIRQMADLSRWLTRHDIIPESQVGYPPHQPEKIQRSFDRNLYDSTRSYGPESTPIAEPTAPLYVDSGTVVKFTTSRHTIECTVSHRILRECTSSRTSTLVHFSFILTT